MNIEDHAQILAKFEQYLNHRVDIIIKGLFVPRVLPGKILRRVHTKYNKKKERYDIRIELDGLRGRKKLYYMSSPTGDFIYSSQEHKFTT